MKHVPWTDEETARLIEIAKDPHLSNEEIFERFGPSRSGVAIQRKMYDTEGIPKRIVRRENGFGISNWTEEADALLREMKAAGVPLREMAERLGRNRNSVSGRVFRLGLSNKAASPIKRVDKAAIRREAIAKLPPADAPLFEFGYQDAFGPGPGVGLGEVEFSACRWPLDQKGFRCCGRPATEPGGSWCAEHHARVFRKPAPTAAAEKDAA